MLCPGCGREVNLENRVCPFCGRVLAASSPSSAAAPQEITGKSLTDRRQAPSPRRRSVRIELQIPVVVRWLTKTGSTLEEATETQVVNAHGCTVTLKAVMFEGTPVEVFNRDTNGVRKGRIVCCGAAPDGRNQASIELAEPDPKFWGTRYEALCPWTGGERRLSPRYKCVGSVGFIPQGAEFEIPGQLSDISSEGCYVDTMSPLPSGTPLQLSVELTGERIQAEAVVRSSHPSIGMGLQFKHLNEENRARLNKVLTRLSEEARAGARPVVEVTSASPPRALSQETLKVLEALVRDLESKGVLRREELLQAVENAKASANSS